MNQLKSRRQWRKEAFRKIKTAEKPVQYASIQITTHNYHQEIATDGSVKTWRTPLLLERQIPLYSHDQTQPYKRLGATLVRDAYCRYFVDDAKKYTYLWWHQDEWIFCRSYLDDEKIRKHLAGKEVYGIHGGEFTCFSAIDADYHGGDYDIFREQLTLVTSELHGKDGWHYSFGPRGCHLIKVHPRARTTQVRANLRQLLQEIDARHPELREKAIQVDLKPISDWEIYPDPKQGFRLPLAQGRVVLLDKPCDNLKSYIKWQIKPSYCPLEQALTEIFKIIQPRAPKQNTQKKPKEKCGKGRKEKTEIERAFGNLRGRYAKVLVDFWQGHNNPPDSLNSAILLTARMMPFYFADAEDAIDYLEELIDHLPEVSFSDRLSNGKRKIVNRIVRQAIRSAYLGNSHQPDPEISHQKLAKTFQAWKSKGFSLVDQSTWNFNTNLLANDFAFSEKELEGIKYFAKILNAEAETTANATRQLLRILAVHSSGQMSVCYVKNLLLGFGIKCGHHGKVNEYLEALCQAGWISLVAVQIPGRRGKLWQVGERMQGKFLTTKPYKEPLSSSIIYVPFPSQQENSSQEDNSLLFNSYKEPPSSSIIYVPFQDRELQKECGLSLNLTKNLPLPLLFTSHFPINRQKPWQREAEIKESMGKRQRINVNKPVKLQI